MLKVKEADMRWIRDALKNKAHVALSVPAVLCCGQFLNGIFKIIETGTIDNATLNTLIQSADGFEAVVIFVIMFVLRKKDK
jgi:hypothetical protein